MTKTRSTKRALVLSALAILMCVSMLVGSTFAWFTDSVTSARNQIVSGNLDVVLYYSTWDSTTNTWSDYAEVNANTKIFDENALYEPGYTEVVRFKVENAGSLALKYNMSATIYKEEAGINVYNEPFNLSEYIYTGKVDVATITDRATAAAQATEKLGTGLNMAAGTSLLPGASEEFALVLTMPTTVGNEANHLKGHQPSIEFGIALVATQFTYEEDDFGPDYDELAGETHNMVNGVNYATFDEAVANATPDANGVVTYFIGGDAVFSGGWGAPIAPAGTEKVVIKGTGTNTSSLNLAHTYRNSLHAEGMVVEISDITIECDPCGTHQDSRNVWVCADELYATNVVFMDPADASNVKKAVFDGCTFASATADEEPSGGNYQLWVGDHDANYGSVTESVVVKNSVFQSGRRAIKLAPTTGSASYTVEIDNNVFYDITYKPAVCLNYGDQANTVTITNNTLYNTALVEDEVNGNYTESNNEFITVATATTPAELGNAIASSDIVNVTLAAGTYKLPTTSDKEVTISGTKDTVIDLSNGTGQMQNMTFVFDGVTVKGAEVNYKGIIHAKSVTYKNCTLTGLQFLYANNVTFENCDFDAMSEEHNIWTYGSKNVSFINCDFTYGDRAINVYTEDKNLGFAEISFSGCTFTTDNTNSKGAVEINSGSFKQNVSVSFVDCTAPAYGDMVGISGWDSANGANVTITVDGVVFTPSTQWTK